MQFDGSAWDGPEHKVQEFSGIAQLAPFRNFKFLAFKNAFNFKIATFKLIFDFRELDNLSFKDSTFILLTFNMVVRKMFRKYRLIKMDVSVKVGTYHWNAADCLASAAACLRQQLADTKENAMHLDRLFSLWNRL